MRTTVDERLTNGRIREGSFASDDRYGLTGAFEIQGKGTRLYIVASGGSNLIAWEHVSVSARHRCPNWDEMCLVKNLFWDETECVIQYHPPKENYISNHPYTLHLWRPIDQVIPMPPGIAVGVKEVGEIESPEQARAIAREIGLKW